jgi:hypothetical protein
MIEPAPPTVDELVGLCAVDDRLFQTTFFPKAARQQPAPFHSDIDRHLNDSSKRYLNLICFRDSAKTTKLRMFTGKRIAYNVSKTILYVGASEAHAIRSIRWIRNRIESKMGAGGLEKKEYFASTFGLRPGAKWTDTELEIFHGVDATPIWILGAGITGNIRGINFDDYRPDLIVLDDILSDENGATLEQREKITDLVMGALKGSLAPATEAPNAKLVMLNTPQAIDDVVHIAEKDPEFFSVRYPCWTAETMGLDVSQQISSWETRHPTEARRAEKRAAISLNRLSIFSKEKEVRVISRETALFREEWLRFYDEAPEIGTTVLAIDPTPPPTKALERKQLLKKDYQVVGAIRRHGGNFYILDYEALQGAPPSWVVTKFFEMRYRWRPYKAIVESVAYQATLKWILEQEMIKRSQFTTIEPFNDIKAKQVRIQSALHGIASQGRLFIKRSMTGFIEQWTKYPASEFDDILDFAAMGVLGLSNAFAEYEEEQGDSNVVPLRARRSAP